MKYLVSFLILLCACAKAPGAATNVQTDSFEKDWDSTLPWWNVDLSKLDFNATSSIITWSLSYGETCTSSVIAVGDKTSGAMTLSSSTETSAVQPSDAPCSMFDGTWTYSLSNSQLSMCQSGFSCVTFQ